MCVIFCFTKKMKSNGSTSSVIVFSGVFTKICMMGPGGILCSIIDLKSDRLPSKRPHCLSQNGYGADPVIVVVVFVFVFVAIVLCLWR